MKKSTLASKTSETAQKYRILVPEKRLSILLARDEEKYCAYCPELDLATQMENLEEVIEDLLEAMVDYAEEYLEEKEVYSKSPNRAHHLPYVEAIKACKDRWELRTLIEIKHGFLHI